MNILTEPILKHHINLRFILTPIAKGSYPIGNGALIITCVYLFGIRIIRYSHLD